MSTDKKQNEKKKMTSRQIVAIAGVVLLVLMYMAALVTAIVDPTGSGALFKACLGATLVVPLLIWIYVWMYGKLAGKHTIADLDIGSSGAPHGGNGSEDRKPSSDGGGDGK